MMRIYMEFKLTTILEEQHEEEMAEMSPVLRAMVDLQSERLSGYHTDLITTWPKLTEIVSPTFLGSYAWSTASEKRRLLNRPYAYNFGGGWVTPADLARDYIKVKYPKRGRVTTGQYHEFMKHRAAPLLAIPCELEDAVYLDVTRTYWSILKIVGWDVDYHPGRFLAPRSFVDDFPHPEIKQATNCMVSVGLIGDMKLWTGSKLVFIKKKNPFINMMLWSLVQDVLNGLAADMEKAGAVYIHTDGYIMPRDRVKDALEIGEAWGLHLRPKAEGKVKVHGVGTYDIGLKETKRKGFKRGIYHRHIEPVHKEWLRYRMRLFAMKREL